MKTTRKRLLYKIKISQYWLIDERLPETKMKRFLCEVDNGTWVKTFNEDKLETIFKRIKEQDW